MASKGGFKDEISYSKHPADHISDFSLYLDSLIYSGDLIMKNFTYSKEFQHGFTQKLNLHSLVLLIQNHLI